MQALLIASAYIYVDDFLISPSLFFPMVLFVICFFLFCMCLVAAGSWLKGTGPGVLQANTEIAFSLLSPVAPQGLRGTFSPAIIWLANWLVPRGGRERERCDIVQRCPGMAASHLHYNENKAVLARPSILCRRRVFATARVPHFRFMT